MSISILNNDIDINHVLYPVRGLTTHPPTTYSPNTSRSPEWHTPTRRCMYRAIRLLQALSNRNRTMERTALITLTLGAILFLAHPAHAQFIGDRMRITSQHGEEIIGQVKSLDNTSLTILTDYSRELGIAYADMVQLAKKPGGPLALQERRRDRFRHWCACGDSRSRM